MPDNKRGSQFVDFTHEQLMLEWLTNIIELAPCETLLTHHVHIHLTIAVRRTPPDCLVPSRKYPKKLHPDKFHSRRAYPFRSRQ